MINFPLPGYLLGHEVPGELLGMTVLCLFGNKPGLKNPGVDTRRHLARGLLMATAIHQALQGAIFHNPRPQPHERGCYLSWLSLRIAVKLLNYYK